ncbi:YciI family protein [Candidatus Terasakiella magnetica]|uniref:YciI family protein n=1 Tax=Candidatus Terasakiella magnetica TaxID=1867952 RepID=A0A1C3RJ76_9PROT|nr:YciI family protein [Candidatus Terasakiella magnetica]SCA57317.1 YciI family protein [Candidatus Terasakiella magnetica]
MQFLVIAKDGKDEDAMERRLATRPAHFEHARLQKKKGILIMGGALLDEHDQMIGSSLFVEIESEDALMLWLAEDPYTKANVWQSFEYHPMKIANLD